jgi:hypothetical protein
LLLLLVLLVLVVLLLIVLLALVLVIGGTFCLAGATAGVVVEAIWCFWWCWFYEW